MTREVMAGGCHGGDASTAGPLGLTTARAHRCTFAGRSYAPALHASRQPDGGEQPR
jgi:hypothetical protein